MKKYTPAVIFLVIAATIVIAITFFAREKNPSTPNIDTSATSTSTATSTPSPSVGTEKYFSMTEVAAHSTQTSCWTAVRGNVYDVTNWIGKHPGGAQAILGLCGKDGTSAFTAKHGGQPNPEAALASFKIGTLKK